MQIPGWKEGPNTVAVHQPNFMPWAGFWNKVVNADLMVLMTGVQFDRGDYQHRVKLNGSWLTVPVRSDQHHEHLKVLAMSNATAIPRIAKTVRQVVMSKKNKYRDRLGGVMDVLDNWHPVNVAIADLNIKLILAIAEALELKTTITVDAKVRDGDKVENLDTLIMDNWPLNWAKPIYLSGNAARYYMDFDSLKYPVETRFQLLSEGISSDSVVQLIAQHEDPMSVIRGCAKWLTKDGVVDDAKAVVGPSASC